MNHGCSSCYFLYYLSQEGDVNSDLSSPFFAFSTCGSRQLQTSLLLPKFNVGLQGPLFPVPQPWEDPVNFSYPCMVIKLKPSSLVSDLNTLLLQEPKVKKLISSGPKPKQNSKTHRKLKGPIVKNSFCAKNEVKSQSSKGSCLWSGPWSKNNETPKTLANTKSLYQGHLHMPGTPAYYHGHITMKEKKRPSSPQIGNRTIGVYTISILNIKKIASEKK